MVGKPPRDSARDHRGAGICEAAAVHRASRATWPRPLMPYRYRQAVLDQLLQHGVRPTTETPPELVYDFVNDLYRYELRRLRRALVTGAIPKVGSGTVR